MANSIVSCLYLAEPVAVLVWAIVSIVLFCSARKKQKSNPEAISEQTVRHRRTAMIVSLVVLGIMVTFLIAIVALFSMAIAYM